MDHTFSALCICALINGLSSDVLVPVEHSIILKNEPDTNSPKEFPLKSDSSTPILVGNNPKFTHLPPKVFPTETPGQNSTGPPVVSVTDTKIISDIKKNHESILNMTSKIIATEKSNTSSAEGLAESDILSTVNENLPPEQYDMLHSKYKGGHDVDELHPERENTEKDEKKDHAKPEKKASEKDEKKQSNSKKDPKSEVSVSPNLDKKGPKLMNETKPKSGESLIESANKMVAMSSSVLSSAQGKQHGIIEPLKTVVTLILCAGFIFGLGVIGLLVWKKISMRRFGRDILINEDDFDEISDMHTFDRAQIKIT